MIARAPGEGKRGRRGEGCQNLRGTEI